MPIKKSAYLAVSLDGFIARKDGGLDWLDRANSIVPKEEDCGFRDFIHSVDLIVMGRKTFEQVLTYFDQWPYGEKPMIILSSKGVKIPERLRKTVTSSSEQPKALVDRLSSQGVKHIYVDGGATIQSFLQAGLIDEITLTLIPVILGEGISLFGPVKNDILLTHLETKTFDFGFVQLKYKIKK